MADNSMADESSSSKIKSKIPRLIGVEYPAQVQNIDRMFKTLGGEEAISKTLSTGSGRKLEMKFRPDDPFSRSLYATRQPATSLLLRVTKRRRMTTPGSRPGETKAEEAEEDEEEEEEEDGVVEEPAETAGYRSELLGVIDTTYRFKGMCDFQYLPVHRSKETGCPESLIEKIVPTKPEGVGFLKRPMPLLLLPPTFSRTDACSEYQFQTETAPSADSLAHKVAGQLDKNIVGTSRARRPHNAYLVSFGQDEIPQAAHPAALLAVAKGKERDSAIAALSDELVALFAKRPVWSRSALKHNCSLTKRQLTVLLPSVSYYFTTGPWRSTWVRLGYDPMADSASLHYQMLDFRLRKSLYMGKQGRTRDRRRRSRGIARDQNLLHASQKPVTPRVSTFARAPWGKGLNQEVRQPQEKGAYYIFREGLVPATNQMFYQLCDLDHEDIQAFIRAKSQEAGPDRPVHYFKQEVLDELRSRLHAVLRGTLEAEERKAAASRVDDKEQPGMSEPGAGDTGTDEAAMNKADSDEEDDEAMERDEEEEAEEAEEEEEEEEELGEGAEVDNLIDNLVEDDDEEEDNDNEMGTTQLLEFLSGT